MKRVIAIIGFLLFLLAGCDNNSPDSIECVLCTAFPRHAPCLVDLNSGEILELNIYQPHHTKVMSRNLLLPFLFDSCFPNQHISRRSSRDAQNHGKQRADQQGLYQVIKPPQRNGNCRNIPYPKKNQDTGSNSVCSPFG